MDLSQRMLDEAKSKDLYNAFHQMALGGALDFATDEFDAVIGVGVFTQGHAPADTFDEPTRITKPGRPIVSSLRVDTYRSAGFKQQQSDMEASRVSAAAKRRTRSLAPDLGLPRQLTA